MIVWIEAKKLTILVYKLTENFPKEELFALTNQMRRAAVSVMSQIAEGWLRRPIKSKLNYLEITMGSLLELENQAEIAYEVKYFTDEDYADFDKQRAKVSYLLYRYMKSIV